MTLLPPIVDLIRTRGQLWLRSDGDLVRRTIANHIFELERLAHHHTLQSTKASESTPEAPSATSPTDPDPSIQQQRPTTTTTTPIIDTTSAFLAAYTPFTYHQALHNRIPGHLLDIGSALDIYRHHPLFIYDILQFPASLANVLRNASSYDIMPCMTPGRLHHHSLDADRAGLPFLREAPATGDEAEDGSGDSGGCVQGMVVFGREKEDRRSLGLHYDEGYVVKLVYVEVSLDDGATRTVPAYVWVRRTGGAEDKEEEEEEQGLEERCRWEDWPTWTIERYLKGDYDDELRDFKW